MSTQNSTTQHYDRFTQFLHWLTAILVIGAFTFTLIWGYFARGSEGRTLLHDFHIWFGVTLSIVIVVRIVWRLTGGRHLTPLGSALTRPLASLLHKLFYLLIVAQVVLGFCKFWVRGAPLPFYNLRIASPFALDPAWRPTINWLHDKCGWLIIILVLGHALMALHHHFGRRDETLRRMTRG